MRARAAATALAILFLAGCGKYGPPLRPAEAARARERAEERERERSDAERPGTGPPAAEPSADGEAEDE